MKIQKGDLLYSASVYENSNVIKFSEHICRSVRRSFIGTKRAFMTEKIEGLTWFEKKKEFASYIPSYFRKVVILKEDGEVDMETLLSKSKTGAVRNMVKKAKSLQKYFKDHGDDEAVKDFEREERMGKNYLKKMKKLKEFKK